MLIVDGPDNVGKTTLVDRLAKLISEEHGLPMIPLHLSKLPDTWHIVDDYAALFNKNVVWDRFHISRQAYGSALNNQEVYTPVAARKLQAMLDLVPTYVVQVHVDDAAWIRKHFGNKDEMYNVEQVVAVNEAFKYQHLFRVDEKIEVDLEGWPSLQAEAIVDRYMTHRHKYAEIGYL